MESNSEVGRVTVSDAAAALLRAQAPRAVLLPRGAMPIKGKGVLTLWWLHAAPPEEDQTWRVAIGASSLPPGAGAGAAGGEAAEGGAPGPGEHGSPERRPGRVSIQAWRDNTRSLPRDGIESERDP